jgi:hypothetical protein
MSFEREKFLVTKTNNIPKKRPYTSALRGSLKLHFEQAAYNTADRGIFFIN